MLTAVSKPARGKPCADPKAKSVDRVERLGIWDVFSSEASWLCMAKPPKGKQANSHSGSLGSLLVLPSPPPGAVAWRLRCASPLLLKASRQPEESAGLERKATGRMPHTRAHCACPGSLLRMQLGLWGPPSPPSPSSLGNEAGLTCKRTISEGTGGQPWGSWGCQHAASRPG